MIGQTPRKRKVNDHKLTVKVKHLNFFLRFALFHKTLLSGLSFFSFFLSAISFIQSNSFLSTSTIISFYSFQDKSWKLSRNGRRAFQICRQSKKPRLCDVTKTRQPLIWYRIILVFEIKAVWTGTTSSSLFNVVLLKSFKRLKSQFNVHRYSRLPSTQFLQTGQIFILLLQIMHSIHYNCSKNEILLSLRVF